MKILIPLLFLTLGANANEVVYGSKSGAIESDGEGTVKLVDVAAGETIQILNVIGGEDNETYIRTGYVTIKAQYGNLPLLTWQSWRVGGDSNSSNESNAVAQQGSGYIRHFTDDVIVGPCSIYIAKAASRKTYYQASYKITKPSAAGTTTSAPILLPPTQDAAKSWFVKLQVSSDLKAWDDVAPGQFLGSDTARFFRIQTTEAE